DLTRCCGLEVQRDDGGVRPLDERAYPYGAYIRDQRVQTLCWPLVPVDEFKESEGRVQLGACRTATVTHDRVVDELRERVLREGRYEVDERAIRPIGRLRIFLRGSFHDDGIV